MVMLLIRLLALFLMLEIVSLTAVATVANDSLKLAFLFITRGPLPFEPIWRRFFLWRTKGSEYSIYVHCPSGTAFFKSIHFDLKHSLLLYHLDYKYHSDSIFYGKEISNRTSLHWGGFDIMSAEVIHS
jgi:hypothetical protein